MFSITYSQTLTCTVLLYLVLSVKLVISSRRPPTIHPTLNVASGNNSTHTSECKHLPRPSNFSLSVSCECTYSSICLHAGPQSNKGDRMESDSPAGNAATLPCYGFTLFGPFAGGECRKRRSTGLLRKLMMIFVLLLRHLCTTIDSLQDVSDIYIN